MKHVTTAFFLIGAMALATPASAQLVNGLNTHDAAPEAPLGTKAGGGSSSINAPGESQAVAGAVKNTVEANRGNGSADGAIGIKKPADASGTSTTTVYNSGR